MVVRQMNCKSLSSSKGNLEGSNAPSWPNHTSRKRFLSVPAVLCLLRDATHQAWLMDSTIFISISPISQHTPLGVHFRSYSYRSTFSVISLMVIAINLPFSKFYFFFIKNLLLKSPHHHAFWTDWTFNLVQIDSLASDLEHYSFLQG